MLQKFTVLQLKLILKQFQNIDSHNFILIGQKYKWNIKKFSRQLLVKKVNIITSADNNHLT